jgi:hypothetical protein
MWHFQDEHNRPRRGRFYAVPFAAVAAALDSVRLVDQAGMRLPVRFDNPHAVEDERQLLAALVPRQCVAVYSVPETFDRALARDTLELAMRWFSSVNRKARLMPRNCHVVYRVHMAADGGRVWLTELRTYVKGPDVRRGIFQPQVVREEEWTLRTFDAAVVVS